MLNDMRDGRGEDRMPTLATNKYQRFVAGAIQHDVRVAEIIDLIPHDYN